MTPGGGVGRASATVVAAFALSALGAAGFALAYTAEGGTQALGLLLAVSLGSLAVGLVVWANRLLPQGPFEEPRVPLSSAPEERARLAADLDRHGEGRRRLIVSSLLAAGAALAGALAVPFRSLGPRPLRRRTESPWQEGVRVVTLEGRPVRADEVPLEGLVTVFPEGHPGSADGQTVLLRVRPELLRPVEGREGWAPGGLLAFSKVCTHAGCPVGLYESDTHTLLCPCHQSAFDVLDGAKPVFGPAAWPLPQLPIAVGEDGLLRAGGEFSHPVGPGWWEV